MRVSLQFVALFGLVLALTTAEAQVQVQVAPAMIGGRAVKKAAPAPDDKKTLESMNLKIDDPKGLVEYFKKRTLTPAELANLEAVITKLGEEDFEVRRSATKELDKFGPGAIGILRRTSTSNVDPEIAYRALESLRNIEKVPHAVVASAAARALAAANHPEAAAAMIGFLPMSDTKKVEEDLRTALTALAIRDNKLAPALVAALKDPVPGRRAAAVSALLRGTTDQKDLANEAVKAVKAILTDEKDPETKFEASYSLVTKQRDADTVGHLIDLLPVVPRGRLWQIEDYLLQLAGTDAPKAKLGPAKEDLEKARDEWRKWWNGAKATRDLAKFEYKPTTTGSLLMMNHDNLGYGNAIMRELGPDMQTKWQFGGIYAPADFQLLPNGNMMVMEMNYQRISERDTTGNILSNFQASNYGQPYAAFRQTNGNTLVAYQRMLVEYDKTWKETGKKYNTQNDLATVEQFEAKGPIFLLTRGTGKIIRLDENLKEIPNPITTGPIDQYRGRLRALSNDRVLVCEQSRVSEYDFKSGKKEAVWTYTIQNPGSAERLPNGNTLISEHGGAGRLLEVTTKGEIVWSQASTDSRLPGRVIRR